MITIHKALSQISAGGPGSGRKPSGGSGEKCADCGKPKDEHSDHKFVPYNFGKPSGYGEDTMDESSDTKPIARAPQRKGGSSPTMPYHW